MVALSVWRAREQKEYDTLGSKVETEGRKRSRVMAGPESGWAVIEDIFGAGELSLGLGGKGNGV